MSDNNGGQQRPQDEQYPPKTEWRRRLGGTAPTVPIADLRRMAEVGIGLTNESREGGLAIYPKAGVLAATDGYTCTYLVLNQRIAFGGNLLREKLSEEKPIYLSPQRDLVRWYAHKSEEVSIHLLVDGSVCFAITKYEYEVSITYWPATQGPPYHQMLRDETTYRPHVAFSPNTMARAIGIIDREHRGEPIVLFAGPQESTGPFILVEDCTQQLEYRWMHLVMETTRMKQPIRNYQHTSTASKGASVVTGETKP